MFALRRGGGGGHQNTNVCGQGEGDLDHKLLVILQLTSLSLVLTKYLSCLK